MITYKKNNQNHHDVYLEKKKVGSIVRVAGGFQYRPKGVKPHMFGDVLMTVEQVKQSLES